MNSLRSILILFPLVTLGPLAIDIFLPALPQMAGIFSTSTTQMQWTITAFIFSLGVGQLFLGPISDGIGRKPIALMGLGLYSICAFIMSYITHFETHLLLRVFQGLGSCAVVVAVFASVTDRFDEQGSSKMYSYLNGVIFCVPALAPILGVKLTNSLGWQSNFTFMAMTAISISLLTWLLFQESRVVNPVSNAALAGSSATNLSVTDDAVVETARKMRATPKIRVTRKIKLPSLTDFRSIASVPAFSFHAIANMLGMAVITAFVSTAPHIFINKYQLSEQAFTYWFGANALLTIVFSFLTPKLLSRFSLDAVITAGMALIALSGLLFATYTQDSNLLTYILPVYLGTIGIALLMGVATGKALASFKEKAGAAAALLGVIQMSGSAVLVTSLQASGVGAIEQMALFSLAFLPMLAIKYTTKKAL